MIKSVLMHCFFNASFLAISFLTLVSCLGGSSDAKKTVGGSSIQNNYSLQRDNFKLNSLDDFLDFLTYEEGSYPLVSAHRGGPSENYPENALETFQKTAHKNPVIIECDVRLTKDSILVLMHDEALDRTSNGKGLIRDFTYDELKNFRLKDKKGNLTKFSIPTLEEVLLWGKAKVIFTLDVKKEVPYALVSDLIDKVDAEAYSVVITYNANQARAVYNINPDLVISASIQSENDLRRLAEIGIPDNKLIAFVGTRMPEQSLISLLHKHGIKVILGTIGNLDQKASSKGYQVYAEYVEGGADILSTDYPFEAKKALDYYIRKRRLSSPYINN